MYHVLLIRVQISALLIDADGIEKEYTAIARRLANDPYKYCHYRLGLKFSEIIL